MHNFKHHLSSSAICMSRKSGIFSAKQVTDIEQYFSEQVGADLPVETAEELSALRQRLLRMWAALVARMSQVLHCKDSMPSYQTQLLIIL